MTSSSTTQHAEQVLAKLRQDLSEERGLWFPEQRHPPGIDKHDLNIAVEDRASRAYVTVWPHPDGDGYLISGTRAAWPWWDLDEIAVLQAANDDQTKLDEPCPQGEDFNYGAYYSLWAYEVPLTGEGSHRKVLQFIENWIANYCK